MGRMETNNLLPSSRLILRVAVLGRQHRQDAKLGRVDVLALTVAYTRRLWSGLLSESHTKTCDTVQACVDALVQFSGSSPVSGMSTQKHAIALGV
jgi:hypothetical protein